MTGPNFEKPKNQPEIDEEQQEPTRRKFLKTAGAVLLFTAVPKKVKEAAAYFEEKTNEIKEGPKIAIEIFFGAHGTGKDAEGLAEKIKNCDVFMPEAVGENKKVMGILSDFSEGRLSPKEFFEKAGINLENIKEGFEPFWAAIAKAIYNTHKIVLPIDVPFGHQSYGRLMHVYKPNFNIPFQQMLTGYKRWLQEFANLQKEREQLILRRLMHAKKEITKGAISKLRGKDPVKILITLGGTHTDIYHKLKTRGETVSQQFSRMPYIMGSVSEEVMRRFLFNKELATKWWQEPSLETSS